MNEQSQPTTSQTTVVPRRLLRRLLTLTAAVLSIGLAFAGGVAVQTSYPRLGQRCFPSLKPVEMIAASLQPSIDSSTPANDEKDSVDPLLSRVGAHARRLAEKKDDLQREDKELNIAYHILRSRGQPNDSPECTRLVERHKQILAVLKELEAAFAEAERLESKLHDLVDARGRPTGDVALDAHLSAPRSAGV